MESWEVEGPVLEWEAVASEQLAKLRNLRQILQEMSQDAQVCLIEVFEQASKMLLCLVVAWGNGHMGCVCVWFCGCMCVCV